jgi:hypothetical protein
MSSVIKILPAPDVLSAMSSPTSSASSATTPAALDAMLLPFQPAPAAIQVIS